MTVPVVGNKMEESTVEKSKIEETLGADMEPT